METRIVIGFGIFIILGHCHILFGQQKGQGADGVLRNAEVLSLTDSQVDRINAIISKTRDKFNRTQRSKRGSRGLPEELAKIRTRAQEDAVRVLTPQQRHIWENLGSSTSVAKGDPVSRSLIIPTIEELKNPPSQGAFGPSTQLAETITHAPLGENYLILTDHSDPTALGALEKLAAHRRGEVIKVKSLGTIYRNRNASVALRSVVIEKRPKFVAIAPQVDSYRENLQLFMLKLLSSLDSDPELDAYPGYLIASSPEKLASLIDRTIEYQPLAENAIDPVSIGAIEDTNASRYRSYQKAKVIQKMFAKNGNESPAIIVTTKESHTDRTDFPDLSGQGDIAMLASSERHTFKEFSDKAEDALNQNNLLFMFGHGTTDRICGSEIDAYSRIDFSNEVVFCGSCMSATPYSADRVDLRDKKRNKRFAFYAMDNGAVMMLGHMGLCGGFPKVYPMAEHVLEGDYSGEAYQKLMNGLIREQRIPDYYPERAPERAIRPDPANQLLYVLWGDPALVPIKKK